MAVSLKLADAYVDVRADLTRLAADLAKVNSMLGGLGGGGVAQAVAKGMATGMAQGAAQGQAAAVAPLGAAVQRAVAAGMVQGMAQAPAGMVGLGSLQMSGIKLQTNLAAAAAKAQQQAAKQAADLDALQDRYIKKDYDRRVRYEAMKQKAQERAAAMPGAGADFGTGALQGLGLSGFAMNPAMALGSMAGGAVRTGWGMIAEGIGESARTAMDLQSTFLDMQRVTGGSAENVGRLKDAVFDIAAKQAGVSVGDVSGIMMGAAKAGVGDKEGDAGLIRFTKGIARIKNAMGEGEGLNAEQLTNDTTKILTVFGLGTESVEGFGSALVRMANASTASGADIVQMTRTLSGTFKSLNVDVGMAMGIASVITDVGLTNQQGANAMSQFLRNMASGSAEMAEKIGMPVEQFQQKVRTDAIGAFQLVLEKFKEINAVDPIKGQEFVKGLGYEGIRAAGAFQQLSSMIDQMQERAKLARGEMTSLAALTAADVLKSEETKSGILKLQNAFIELKDAVGTHFLPAISLGTAALTDLARAAAGNMPTIVGGVGMAGKAAAGALGGPAATAAMAAGPGAMDWLFGGPEGAPALPGKASGMFVGPPKPVAESPAAARARMLADVEADNERRRAMAAARPWAATIIADMAEDIGGVGNLLNFPSRFKDAGGLAGWGLGQGEGGTSGAMLGRRTAASRTTEEVADDKTMAEFARRREKFAEDQEAKRQNFQSQTFGGGEAFASSFITGLLEKDNTPKMQLDEQRLGNKLLQNLVDKILPPREQKNEGMMIFQGKA